MHDIVIYGAGGFGRETALMIEQINERYSKWNLLGFCDDGLRPGTRVDGYDVVGGSDFINKTTKPLSVAIAIADCSIRKQLREKISNALVAFPTLIHPAVLSGDGKRNTFGEGVIITAGNVLTTNIHIGAFAIINLSCTIGHDVTMGDYCTVMPACSLSGFITIGDETLIGTGARILPNLKIGKRSRIGAGAVVTKSVDDSVTVIGIPAEPIDKIKH